MFTNIERTDIFIRKLVREPDSLRLVFDRAAVDNRMLELVLDRSMNVVTLRALSA